mmetsp:Transcript_10087/g.15789  ORF Transcript_10087/g.15789 Transcript_10087/m.15789 type:complete len:111 (-) Transcript_10087:133-465(-)
MLNPEGRTRSNPAKKDSGSIPRGPSPTADTSDLRKKQGPKTPKTKSEQGASGSKPQYPAGTKVQVLLDDGEWIGAHLTGQMNKVGKYEVEFAPGDCIFARLPNDYVRLAV